MTPFFVEFQCRTIWTLAWPQHLAPVTRSRPPRLRWIKESNAAANALLLHWIIRDRENLSDLDAGLACCAASLAGCSGGVHALRQRSTRGQRHSRTAWRGSSRLMRSPPQSGRIGAGPCRRLQQRLCRAVFRRSDDGRVTGCQGPLGAGPGHVSRFGLACAEFLLRRPGQTTQVDLNPPGLGCQA